MDEDANDRIFEKESNDEELDIVDIHRDVTMKGNDSK